MFVQIIEGRTTDGKALMERGQSWQQELRPGAKGYLGVTAGVTGMRFKLAGDFLKAIEVCDPAARLLVAREDGMGKRTPFEDYRLVRRGGTGVIAIDLPADGSVNVADALALVGGPA